MHCDMLKIQDGGAIVEKLNYIRTSIISSYYSAANKITLFILSLQNFRTDPGIFSNKKQPKLVIFFLYRAPRELAGLGQGRN